MRKLNINQIHADFEKELDRFVLHSDVSTEMLKPMIYSLKGGGKRLRPIMLLATLSIYDHQLVKFGMATAIALEYIHTYSLIHDDLPAMDNDELRRGNPTNHIQFNEATAILAGDALLTDAFSIIADDENLKAKQKVQIISALSMAAGSSGMVAGQLKDVTSQSDNIKLKDLETIHALKTGCLFNFPFKAASVILNLEPKAEKLLEKFGHSFGIAYQIHNDLKDIIGTPLERGKKNQSDIELNKATYPALLGTDKAIDALNEEIKKAKITLKRLSKLTGNGFDQLEVFLKYLELDALKVEK